MTNAEVVIKGLLHVNEFDSVVDYIACPYVSNAECKYDGGKDYTPCIECKSEWLQKDFED